MEQIKELIYKKIEEFDTIIIHRHVNPDPDALGSQGGLQKVIQKTFPEKKVFVVGEEVNGLKFLNRMDEISDDTYKGALIIVCDTANTERISDSRYNKGDYLIKIDHHPLQQVNRYGDLEWVDTSYSSTSEMIVDLVKTINEDKKHPGVLNLSDEAARLLYAGIVGDTGRFLYDNTTAQTMNYAGELLSYNFEPREITDEFDRISRETAKLQGYILQNFDVTENGVASLFISKQLLKDFNVEPVEAANLVNTLANIEGNNIWVFFVEYDEEIRVRIRSRKTAINEVAIQFSGGGHPLASGATVQTKLEGQELISALDSLLENKKK